MDSSNISINKHDIARLRDLVDGASRVAITVHMSPDGDAIGSSMGLARVLMAMGKEVSVITPDVPSVTLRFLYKQVGITVFCEQRKFAKQLLDSADLIFCLDYNALKRIDEMAPLVAEATAPKVLIDHHTGPEDFCDITISRPEVSSTCLLLFKVICALELLDAVDDKAASSLLAGMMTDTGNFCFNNAADPEIYRVTAYLMEKGARRLELVKRLFDTFSADCLRLNAYAIGKKMELWEDKGAALITLTRAEINRFGYKPGYTEGLVNKPLAIESIKYAVYLREESKYIKVSMRSKGTFPCNTICAERFNGGGHLNAAGGEFHGTMEQAVEVFKSMIDENYEKYLKK